MRRLDVLDGETLTDCAGRQYPMVGAYPFKTRMLPRLKALGYREVVAATKTFIAPAEKIRGHEFHYSELRGFVPGKKVQTAYSMDGPNNTKSNRGLSFLRIASAVMYTCISARTPSLPEVLSPPVEVSE